VQSRVPGRFSRAKRMSGKIKTVRTGHRAHNAAILELPVIALRITKRNA
jgi:hypothetical protein